MRKAVSLLKHIPVLILGVVVLTSCVKEDVSHDPDYPGSKGMTTLRMLVPGAIPVETRSATPGTPIENRITDINVLVFDGNSKLVEIVPGVNPVPQSGGDNSQQTLWTFKAAVPSGAYDLMAIANAGSMLSGLSEGDTKDDVAQALLVENTGMWGVSTVGSESTMTSIPMWGEITGQTISPSLALEFRMVRMVARINVDATAVSSNFKLTSVKYYNRNTKGFVIPSGYTTSEGKVNITAPTIPSEGLVLGYAQEPIAYDHTYITDYKACVEKIYVFEAAHKAVYGAGSWRDNPCLVIGGVYHETGAAPSDPKSVAPTFYRLDFIEKDKTTGSDKWLNILRNHSYNFTITSVSGDGYMNRTNAVIAPPINMESIMVELDDMEYVVSDGKFYIAVTKKEFEFSSDAVVGYESENIFTVKTTSPSGYRTDVFSDLAGTAVPNDEVTGRPWITVSSGGVGVDGRPSKKIELEKNTTSTARTAYIHITTERMKCIVKVIQNPEQLPPVDPGEITGGGNAMGLLSYVGAFWKADQTGERIIHVPTTTDDYAGNWAVQVLEYGYGFTEGDIVFMEGGSSDPAIYSDNPGDAESFQVSSSSTKIYAKGTATTESGITFRIGLKSKWDSTHPLWKASNPVRYARVVVSFGNEDSSKDYPHNRVIYIRQGHAPDFLMRKGDDGRITVAKFSPYNLTAAEFKNNSIAESVNIGKGNGTMTDYPTQAGALFQWAQSNGVIAYNPTIPNKTKPDGYQTTTTVTDFWDVAKQSYESCPAGYRRPSDGITNGIQDKSFIPDSEMFQSLFLNPPTTTGGTNDENSLWGYYADGFFDRRLIDTQPAYSGSVAESAVNINTSTVAYQGRLFFNPYNNASLFFPASGRRNTTNGALVYTGMFCYYWTASSGSNGDSYYMQSLKTGASRNLYSRHFAKAIRCVVDTTYSN